MTSACHDVRKTPKFISHINIDEISQKEWLRYNYIRVRVFI